MKNPFIRKTIFCKTEQKPYRFTSCLTNSSNKQNNFREIIYDKKMFYNEEQQTEKNKRNRGNFDRERNGTKWNFFGADNSSKNNYQIKRQQTSIKKRDKTPKKNQISKLEKSIKTSKKMTEEEIKLERFIHCMNYYSQNYGNKSPIEISFNDIHTLGLIYYLVKFPLFIPYYRANISNDYIIGLDENFREIHIPINHHFDLRYPREGFAEKLIRNNKISERIFINNGEIYGFTQLAQDFSQDCKLSSGKQSSNVIMKSIRYCENTAFYSFDINEIKQDLNHMFSVNKIEEKYIDKYDLIFVMKGHKIHGESEHDRDLENFLYFFNTRVLCNEDKLKKQKEKKNYYFKFSLGEQDLAPVKVKNNENISGMNDTQFNNRMKEINYGEEIIMAFKYNPTIYFDINTGENKISRNHDYQSITFIDCSKNNEQLYNIFNLINDSH